VGSIPIARSNPCNELEHHPGTAVNGCGAEWGRNPFGGRSHKVSDAKNLDVARTSHGPEIGHAKGVAGGCAVDPLLSSLCTSSAQPAKRQKHRQQYRCGGTKYITVPQATNIIDAVDFARFIGLPLASIRAESGGWI
jgi:hypothetical protein